MQQNCIDAATPQSLAGYCGLIEWAQRFGHEVGDAGASARQMFGDMNVTALEVSIALSASFNPGFAPDGSVYLMVSQDEFEWLTRMPIETVLVAQGLEPSVWVLCRGIRDGEFEIPPHALRLQTDQPATWARMRSSSEIRFGCVHGSSVDYHVEEFQTVGYPLQFQNS